MAMTTSSSINVNACLSSNGILVRATAPSNFLFNCDRISDNVSPAVFESALPFLESFQDFKREIIQRRFADRIAIERQRQAQQTFALGDVLKLRFGDFGRHTFERTDVDDRVNVSVPMFVQ